MNSFFDKKIYAPKDNVFFLASPLSAPFRYYMFKGKMHSMVELQDSYYYTMTVDAVLERDDTIPEFARSSWQASIVTKLNYNYIKTIKGYKNMTRKRVIDSFGGVAIQVAPVMVFDTVKEAKMQYRRCLGYIKQKLATDVSYNNARIRTMCTMDEYKNMLNEIK